MKKICEHCKQVIPPPPVRIIISIEQGAPSDSDYVKGWHMGEVKEDLAITPDILKLLYERAEEDFKRCKNGPKDVEA